MPRANTSTNEGLWPKGKHTIEADWCKHCFFTLQHMAQCNSTTITNPIPCPLSFIHLNHLCHSQKHHSQQTLHVHFCQCCVSLQRFTKHFHANIPNTVVCHTNQHSMLSVQLIHHNKCHCQMPTHCTDQVLSGLWSSLHRLRCTWHFSLQFYSLWTVKHRAVHDIRFSWWTLLLRCVETSQVKTI